MLETIQEYARERLAAAGETAALAAWHAHYFLALAETAEPQLLGKEQGRWLARLEAEHDNLRAVLHWAGARDPAAPPAPTPAARALLGLRLAGPLWRFWAVRGYFSEGRAQLATMLTLTSSLGAAQTPALQTSAAKALHGAGGLAHPQGNYAAARVCYEASLALWRALQDAPGMALSLSNLGMVAYEQGDYSEARRLYEESLALLRSLSPCADPAASLTHAWARASAISRLGDLELVEADHAAARALFTEGRAISRAIDDPRGVSNALNNLGNVALYEADYPTARAFYETGLALRRELGDKWGIAHSLNHLGLVAHDLGEDATARALLTESLTLSCELGDRWVMAYTLEYLASLDPRGAAGGPVQGRSPVLQRAAQLLGAVAALRVALGAPLAGADQARYEHTLA